MKKMRISKVRVEQEMALEYHFDYKEAKPNRFAEKMNLNVAWTVDKFVAESKPESVKSKPAKTKPSIRKKTVP